jgi:uncharacterized membrane protein YkoI
MKVRLVLWGIVNAGLAGAVTVGVWAAEVKVSIDQVPAAVKATILKEGGRIEDIARKASGTKTIYEADVIKDGKEVELRVAEDGKLISRKIEGDAKGEENEEEETDGKDEGEAAEAHREAKACVEGMKALAEAKVTMLQAVETATKEGKGAKPFKADLEFDEGRLLFDIELLDGDKGPEMEIDAINGKVIRIESVEQQEKEDAEEGDQDSKEEQQEARDKAAAAKALPQAKVTLAQAVKIAMKETKGKAYKAEFKPENGHPRYEVQAAAGGKCMEVAICGVSYKWYAAGVGLVKDDEFVLAHAPKSND